MSRKCDETEREPSSEIVSGGVYGLAEFKARSGLGDSGLRNARRAGLRVLYAHNRGFVLGADFVEYLRSAGTLVPPGPEEGQDPRRRNAGGEE
jgi:hypothetical protein